MWDPPIRARKSPDFGRPSIGSSKFANKPEEKSQKQPGKPSEATSSREVTTEEALEQPGKPSKETLCDKEDQVREDRLPRSFHKNTNKVWLERKPARKSN